MLLARIIHAFTDWPQWRGPDRSGTWYNGPSIGFPDPRVDQKDLGSAGGQRVQWAHCFKWTGICDGLCRMVRKDPSAWMLQTERSSGLIAIRSPTMWVIPPAQGLGLISKGKAYSWGTMGHLHCLDANTGEVLWQVNAMEQYQSRIPIWGLASNPIMVDETPNCAGGWSERSLSGAFHKRQGKEVWRALDDEASYSAPVLINQAGKQVLVCWTGESISGLNPLNGQVYWSVPFQPGKMIMNIADPVYDPPYLFLSGFFDGSYLLKLDQETTSAAN